MGKMKLVLVAVSLGTLLASPQPKREAVVVSNNAVTDLINQSYDGQENVVDVLYRSDVDSSKKCEQTFLLRDGQFFELDR